MTFAKISAGTGYLYLIRHTALGDAEPTGERDAAAYYSAQGNPPGRWTGRGAPLLGLAGRTVAEGQMRGLFGLGAHPDMDAIVDAHIDERWRPWMTGERWDRLVGEAIRSATLGRQFPRYRQLDPFGDRVAARLDAIRGEAGREPTEAEAGRVRAREARRQRDAVAGYDLVFSPVKSAALLWAVDPRPRVQEGIAAAHAAAKDAALAVLEEHAAFTRTGTDGVAQIATRGLIAAEFEHWDSRAGDPNLHTHVAVSSKVMGIDGIWRALDGRPLHSAAVAISETYNTVFEAELTARLGVTFTARPGTPDGREPVREITGVPPAMVEHFSRRRAAIEARYAELERAYRDEHGREPDAGSARRLARQANLETREGKRPPVSLADKRAAWRKELASRFGTDAVHRLMNVIPDSAATAAEDTLAEADCEDLADRIMAAVSTRRSTWTVWNVRAEVERQLRKTVPALTPGRHRETVGAIIEAVLARSVCVEPPPQQDEPSELRRPGGESVFTQHAAARYTCQAVLDAETRLIAAARTLTAAGLSGPAVAAALDGFEARVGTALDPGQRHLVTVFAADSRLLLAGIGPAGAGKTTAMRALAHVLRHGGRNLVPLATSAAAADVLGRELGVCAENLHKFLHEWTAGPFAARLQSGGPVPAAARMFRLGPGDVILVDEAGMAGTVALDDLTAIAAKRGAVVRLLGDDRQLPAVDAGGALRLVAAEPSTPELTTLYRFRDPAEAAATLQLRAGDPDAVDWYHERDRIRGGSRQAMAQAAYDGWKADMLAGKVTLMAALAGTEVTALAARARADRVIAGQVEPEGTQLHDGNLAGRGDWIVTRCNDRRLATRGSRDWVKNGDAWTVERRDHDGALTVKNITHGGRITLPADYVAAHVQLLYATTSHRAQGSTVDTAHPLITENMTREALYVLASRARERTTLYVATHDEPVDSGDDDAHVNEARHDPHRYEAREILQNILANESAALSATEAIATAREDAASLATMIPRYVHGARQYAATRGFSPGASSAGILPWVPSPPEAASDRLATYLIEAAAEIDARIEQLADAVVRDRPGWATPLGRPPQDPERNEIWRQQIEIIAAYRDQQRVAIDDPRQILGPYPDPEHSAFAAHRHAAQAMQTARALAETEQPNASSVDTHSARDSDAPYNSLQPNRSSRTSERLRASELRSSRQQADPTLLEPRHAPHQQASHSGLDPRP